MADTVEVVVERLGALGDGVASHAGAPLIVPFALPGERVAVRLVGRRGGVALSELCAAVAPSPDRVAPPCRHFAACGGCALQHAAPGPIADWRRQTIVEALARAGLEAPVAAPVGAGGGGRRRASWSALMLHGGHVLLGYHQRRGKRLVDIQVCPQVDPALFALAQPLREALRAVLSAHETADATASRLDNGIDLLLVGPRALSLDARMALTELAERCDLARVAWQPREREPAEPVALRRVPTIAMGGVPVQPPPGAFLQATAAGEAAMVACATAWLDGAGHVADLYAGCGTFAFPLVRGATVVAYEGSQEMAAALDAAARAAQLTGRLTVARRDLEIRPLQRDEMKKLDGLLLDPPRAGATRQCAVLASYGPARVVMASCYPPSFARDARTLVDGGYRLVEVQPVDQFGWSHHVELIARFER
ncbi:MAG: class I SAM-dependent RNA methyltransferase [Alphaproteobacteria bacterium]